MTDLPATPEATGAEPFACPRCGEPAAGEAFYGPCRACRAELVATQGGEAKSVTAQRFEPRMHVTPGAVALKE
jgi:hypothetical protein